MSCFFAQHVGARYIRSLNMKLDLEREECYREEWSIPLRRVMKKPMIRVLWEKRQTRARTIALKEVCICSDFLEI